MFVLNVEGCRARGESPQKVNLRRYREQVLTSFMHDVRTSPAGMQDLVKQVVMPRFGSVRVKQAFEGTPTRT